MKFPWFTKRGMSASATTSDKARQLPIKQRRLEFEALEERVVPALATIDLTTVTAKSLVSALLGGGVTATNIKYTGAADAAGKFAGGTGIIGFDAGIILSSGDVKNVIGPNTSDAITKDNGQPGDSSLDTLVSGGQATHDAATLEFDFVPTTSQLSFQYVFASDEYNEFANSAFNDVFGFFVNGQNVALLPNTTTPVSINNVNGGNPLGTNPQNSQFFINNRDFHLNTEMDGLTVVLTATANVNAGQVNHIKLGVADVGDSILDSNVFIKAGSFSSGSAKPPTPPTLVTGADAGGGPEVRVFDPKTRALTSTFMAYDPNFTGGVRVATGDVNGDGINDIITAPGPGGGPNVKVFNGVDNSLLYSFFAYDPAFTGGVFVAAGDVNGDGKADIVTTPDVGGGPQVNVYNGADLSLLKTFMAYDFGFRGGVRVATGDINGDGLADIVTGAGPGGGPNVKAFNATNFGVIRNFMAFDPAFTGGVFVAVGNFKAPPIVSFPQDIVVGAGAGGGPEVRIFDSTSKSNSFTNFNPEDVTSLIAARNLQNTEGIPELNPALELFGGVRVATVDVTGDGKSEIVTSFGSPHRSNVKVFDAVKFTQLDDFFVYDKSFRGGVFVGGSK